MPPLADPVDAGTILAVGVLSAPRGCSSILLMFCAIGKPYAERLHAGNPHDGLRCIWHILIRVGADAEGGAALRV